MSEIKMKHCCFCFAPTDVGIDGDGFSVRITKEGSPFYQVLYAHLKCLMEGLDRRAMFQPDIFEEDGTD